MSDRKQRREIDKAIEHLQQFQAENAPWDWLMDEFLTQIFGPLARRFELDVGHAEDLILGSDYYFMAIGYIFEEFATAVWDNAPGNMIDEYLQKRGWREGSHGRHYLRALSESELKLWEVVDSRPGVSVDIRLFGSKDKPQRVREKSASESLQAWDCIAARVMRVEGQPTFAGGMLLFSRPQAGVIQRALADVREEVRHLLVAAKEAGEPESLPDDLEEYLEIETESQFAEVAFTVWASGILEAQDRPSPRLFNMDNELIELTRVRFPITGDREAVKQALASSAVLSQNEPDSWIWYPRSIEAIAEGERVGILGSLWLKHNALELETNSSGRAERGGALIKTLAGGHLGEPLTVHENLEKAIEDCDWDDGADEDLNALPELQAILQEQITAHYRQTLDEPVPMLNGDTPRACAADPQKREAVIEWLKFLENSDRRSPSPDYEFAWMWEELGLDRD